MKIYSKSYGNENIICEYYNNKPALIVYCKNDKLHNPYGPAYIRYHPNGNVHILHYRLNDAMHNINGPAEIVYNENGSIKLVEYRIDNKLHNPFGPAKMLYENDKIDDYEWWHNGYNYTYEIFYWLQDNNIDKWQDMCEDNFNRM